MNDFPQQYFILSPFQNTNYHIQKRCFPQGTFFVVTRKPPVIQVVLKSLSYKKSNKKKKTSDIM